MTVHASLVASETLSAPIRGVYGPLGETPDEAMASGVLGPGLQVEPLESELISPCGGCVISVARSCHAVTLKTAGGAEILIHVGVDTVKLDGKGFDILVKEGQEVKPGDRLLTFDPMTLLQHARSLCIPIILLTPDTHTLTLEGAGGLLERGVPVGFVTSAGRQDESSTAESEAKPKAARRIVLQLADGLHARPAAQIARLAKTHLEPVQIGLGAKRANAKSVASLMSLGAAHGASLEISAMGSGADTIVEALHALIAEGAGDQIQPIEERAVSSRWQTPVSIPVAGENLSGIVASSGLAIGPIVRHVTRIAAVPDSDGGEAMSLALFQKARKAVASAIQEEAIKAPADAAGLLSAHIELVDDPELIEAAASAIRSGSSAGAAVQTAIRNQSDSFMASGNLRLAERVADLRDIESRLLNSMYGEPEANAEIPAGAIIVAEDLLPSEFLAYVGKNIAGICLADGGRTSHVSILAASESIPALVAMGDRLMKVPDGLSAILDTSKAALVISPGADAEKELRDKISFRRGAIAVARQFQNEAANTRDGTLVHVHANLASLEDASKAVLMGAEGSGLLRTEFLFTNRITPPDEAEQTEAYRAIVQCMKRKTVTIRTLDIGGDKPVPFLSLGHEPNPALGLRGVRTLLAYPDLMRDQIRAILKASNIGSVLLMVPMVSSASEISTIREYVIAQAKDLGISQIPPIGTMVETPASAMISDQLADVADFLSIGTNDLTQYTLAMDRGHPALAGKIDGLHPAVLRLMQIVAKVESSHGIPVSVCGGLASDPLAVPLLLGMGIRKLSCTSSMIAPVKAIVREIEIGQCEIVSGEALNMRSAGEVREHVLAAWPSLDRWT